MKNGLLCGLALSVMSLWSGTAMADDYVFPEWNESEISFTPDRVYDNYNGVYSGWSVSESYIGFERSYFDTDNIKESSLSASVTVDQPSVFYFKMDGPYYYTQDVVKLYVDGVLQQEFSGRESSDHYWSATLSVGSHSVMWTATNEDYIQGFRIREIGCVATPDITVNLLEPGSLGTEILYNVNHLKEVRNLKVIGRMNIEDWEKVKMLTNLHNIDLSEAITDTIIDGAFKDKLFMDKVVLPNMIEHIGEEAFFRCGAEEVNMPTSLTLLGNYAFRYSNIASIDMPDGFLEMGYDCFDGCANLRSANLGQSMQVIPGQAFRNCSSLRSVVIPETVTRIEGEAFQYAESLASLSLPESLISIGWRSFMNCSSLTSLIIPNKTERLETDAFAGCSSLEHVEVSASMNEIAQGSFSGCGSLKTMRLNSATVAIPQNGSSGYPIWAEHMPNITFQVPQFLVNQYKLHEFWYNGKDIVGLPMEDINPWIINDRLVLDSHSRFVGSPDVVMNGVNVMYYSWDEERSFKVLGDAELNINDLYLNNTGTASAHYYPYAYFGPTQLLSNCSNVNINGNIYLSYPLVPEMWYFFSLPFDAAYSDITTSVEGAQFALHTYDGASRAENTAAVNWKKCVAGDIIPAGTGFIIQVDTETKVIFASSETAAKGNCMSNKDITLTLQVNPSETASNAGWNLIGNPWQCYYNSHYLNFTAPITVWNYENRTYDAYSIIDDDYAIRPNEAIFVQCPNETLNTIGFPIAGRQLNTEIQSMNPTAAPARSMSRFIVDLALSNGDLSDRTRVVLNEKASLAYEAGSDASKLMSIDNEAPQLFTIDNAGNAYAINERPEADGNVTLSFKAPKSGTYTIELGRCDAEQAALYDAVAEKWIDLKQENTYTFKAEAGENAARFILSMLATPTGIETLENAADEMQEPLYTIDGRRAVAGEAQNGIFINKKGAVIVK